MSQPALEPADAGVLEQEIPCASCGYNLKGLQSNSICPECAHPIAASLNQDHEPLGPPREARWIWCGLWGAASSYLVYALALAYFGYRLGMGLLLLCGLIGLGAPTAWVAGALIVDINSPPVGGIYGIAVIVASAALLWAISAIALTVPKKLRQQRPTLAITVTASTVASVMACALVMLLVRRPRVYWLLPGIGAVMNAAASAALLMWLGHLADRMRMPRLKRLCPWLAGASILTNLAISGVYVWEQHPLNLVAFGANALSGAATALVIVILLVRARRYKRSPIS